MSNDTEKGNGGKQYLPTSEALVSLVMEYLLKGLIVLTGCVVTVLVVWYYCQQFVTDGKKAMDIKDVIIIGGLGFGVMVKFYFGEVKGKRSPSNR